METLPALPDYRPHVRGAMDSIPSQREPTMRTFDIILVLFVVSKLLISMHVICDALMLIWSYRKQNCMYGQCSKIPNQVKCLHAFSTCQQLPCRNAMVSSKTKGRQFDNFVVIGGTISCSNDNLRCHQWWRSCQSDDLCFQCIRMGSMPVEFRLLRYIRTLLMKGLYHHLWLTIKMKHILANASHVSLAR